MITSPKSRIAHRNIWSKDLRKSATIMRKALNGVTNEARMEFQKASAITPMMVSTITNNNNGALLFMLYHLCRLKQ
jgi:hypothetical protein